MTAPRRPRARTRNEAVSRAGALSAPAIDIQVASPLWQAQPLAEQTVRDGDRRGGGRSQQPTAK